MGWGGVGWGVGMGRVRGKWGGVGWGEGMAWRGMGRVRGE